METDEKLRFLETRITSSLKPRNDDLKALFADTAHRNTFLEFCNNEDVRRLFVFTKEPKATLVASLEPPTSIRSKAVFFLKTGQATKLTKDNIHTDVVFIDCERTVLRQLDLIIKEVFLPLLCTDGSQTFGKVSADKLMDILHRLMATAEVTDGCAKGEIVLPLPSIEVLAEAAATPTRQASVIHVLETSVIGWIKQIKLVLRHDPLSDLQVTYGPVPLPLDEVDLWRRREEKLLSINRQLDSPVATSILQNLDEASSAYSQSFRTVRKEITQALTETEENLRYLETMLPSFEQLHSAKVPEQLLTMFTPLMYTIMLVWRHSKFYHEPANFQNLLGVVSNEVVIRAKTFVGKDILQNTVQSYAGLKEALRVCAAYRGTYLDMKDRGDVINEEKVSEMAEVMNLNPPKGLLYTSKLYNVSPTKPPSRESADLWRDLSGAAVATIGDNDWEDSPWPARNAPCFNLMNSFMERCNDLLELVQTTRHFSLLARTAEVGGAGTEGLDALVREIHEEFTSSMDAFGSMVVDILDVSDNHTFEKGFFHFRSVVKDLERRLASVLLQSFQQCPTIGARLRLLEVFEGVSGRELVQEYLKDKDRQLIKAFTDEMIAVRSMFATRKTSPPLHTNLPPIVSCVTWVRALQRRVKEPMEKLKRISPQSLEGDSGWHLRDIYGDTTKELESFEEKTIADWQGQLYTDLRDRLKQPLLVSDDFDHELEGRPQVLSVNLDPALLLLLREVHYLSKDPFNVRLPEVIRDLLRHTDASTLRMTAARLATIVSKYNSAIKSMMDFEKPLFERKLAKIDQLLDQGLNHYTWKMTESEDFIELASSLVGKDLHRTLAIIQSNCQDMVAVTQSWSDKLLDVFEAREASNSYLMNELLIWQRELDEDLERLVKPSGVRIHSLLQNSFQAIQISQASPAWEEYVDHIDALVLDGLKSTTVKSLRSMLSTMTGTSPAVQNSAVMSVPILTINLELIENEVTFTPPLDENTAITNVLENVRGWLEGFKRRGLLVKMLNPLAEGNYHDYIMMDEEVIELCEQILTSVTENGEECKKLLDLFKGYRFLWAQDIAETFDEFLQGRLSPNPLRAREASPSARLRSAASERSVKSAQSGRASSASNYSISQTGAMGTAERAFLRPDSDEHSESPNVPSLDMFDSEIDVYRSARDEVAAVVSHQDVGWIRVDLQPIKRVLITYASRWMWTFTKYLCDQVTALLQDSDDFLTRVEPEIEGITGEERDTVSFMKMMRIFNEISAKQNEIDGQFTAMNRTVLLLQKYEQCLPDKTKQLYDAAPGRWTNLKTKVSLAKQRLGPRIQGESASITKDLEAFGRQVLDLESDLSKSMVYSRECNIDEAFESISEYTKQLDLLDNEAQDLIELQELLETAVVNFTVLPEIRQELRNLHEVFETVQAIQGQQESWKHDSWQKQNTEYMKSATKEQLEMVRALPEAAQLWDVYSGLQESILVIQACLPLIEDLSNPAMRTRHWKQLVRVTGGALLTDNSSLQAMTLGQLLQLGLQNHEEEVKSIVQRAIKDVTIEGALKTYEEIWLSKLFEMRPHARSLNIVTAEKTEKEDTDTKSEYTQSDMSISLRDPSKRRAGSRMSSLTLGSGGRARRTSVSSLPVSLLNLGEDTGHLSLLSDPSPIFAELESHQIALQGMQTSSAAGSFLDEVTKWQKRLQTLESVLTVWLEVQEKWVELEEVFSNTDIKNALSHESRHFTSANRDFRLLMRATEKNPNVLQCCQRKGILAILEKMNSSLEICRKSLLQHLEKRRQRFPRFYFISMEDVLHIVCNSYDLRQVNLYLPKLFENIGRLEFEEMEGESSEEPHMEITGLVSCMGEKLPLKQSVSCEGDIEQWLSNLLLAIKGSLQQQLSSVLKHDVMQDGFTCRPKLERTIQSAGARRVTVTKDNDKGSGSRSSSRNSQRPGKNHNVTHSAALNTQQHPGSWLLDHTSEVAHLALQVQLTSQMNDSVKLLEDGNHGESLKKLHSKITSCIQAAVKMLKGVKDGQGKMRARRLKERTKQEERERKSRSESLTERSQTGRLSSRSNRGSQRSLNDPTQMVTASPIAEEGGTKTGLEALAEDGKDGDTIKLVLPTERSKVEQVVETEADCTDQRPVLSPAQVQNIGHLIAVMSQYRDYITSFLNHDENQSEDPLELKCRLQCYWNDADEELAVKMMDSVSSYGFEYLGSSPRLILTPLCNKMFVSMMQAISSQKASLCSGSDPIDRVETVRELSRVMGQPMYSFNCSQAMDAAMLGDILKGLASTGAWISFNNLSNILPAALSVFSQLLRSYFESIKAKKTVMAFPNQGEEVALNPNGACFITIDTQIRAPSMSPVDKLMRLETSTAKLPREVTANFREVAVVSPDMKIILEVNLLRQGFHQSNDICRRLLALREMCTSLLPSIQPYSDGYYIVGDDRDSHGWTQHIFYRVITEAGSILNDLIEQDEITEDQKAIGEMKASDNNNNSQREEDELKTYKDNSQISDDQESGAYSAKYLQFEYGAIVTAIQNTFLPRLHSNSAEMFFAMIGYAFPDVKLPLRPEVVKLDEHDVVKDELDASIVSTRYPSNEGLDGSQAPGGQSRDDLRATMELATQDLGLLYSESFQYRVTQLAQLVDSHQTVVVSGPAGCGKSEVIKTLIGAHKRMGRYVPAYRVYTQSVESKELLGYLDQNNREWKDGLFTTLLRQLIPPNEGRNRNAHLKVLHLDGEIDPSQMEIFSCVIQEPHSLCLANNERINMPDNVRIIWEIESLAALSPSVLSDTGLLSMSKNDISWQSILTNWIRSCPQGEREIRQTLADRYVRKTLDYLGRCTQPAVMVKPRKDQERTPKMERVVNISHINMVMTFCRILEATNPPGNPLTELKLERLINFAAIWAFAGTLEDRYRTAFSAWWRSEFGQYVDFPESGEVFDYFVDGETQEFVHWETAVPPYSMAPHEGIPPDAYVHTVSNEQLSYLLGILSDVGKPVMLVGPSGCGKTTILNERIRTVCSGEVAEVLSLTVSSNRFTTSRVLWKRLEEILEWRHGKTFVPRGNKKLLYLVDDLNLAHADQYGHQSACEMVRQHMDCGDVYEPDSYRLREVNNLTYIASFNPNTKANVSGLSPRLLRHFSVFAVPYPTSAEIHTIFTTLLNTHFLTPSTTSSSGKDGKKLSSSDQDEEKLRSLISMIVTVTIEVQDRMRTMFLATAERCHYIFTLRDMRRLYRNICLSLAPGVSPESLLLLWRHECEWIYGGRLVSPVDMERFNLTFVTAARKQFTSEELLQLVIDPAQPLFSNLVQQDSGMVTAGGYRGNHNTTDQYGPCNSVDRVRALMTDAVDEYNKEQPKIKLSLYTETIQKVCRLARTIQSPHDVSHILIVAEGNPGLASVMARLAANLSGFCAFDINPSPSKASREHKLKQFKADLVFAYTRAGVKREKIVFLLNDEQLQEEDFLVYMEEYVVTGAITHMFTPEEQTTVINAIRTEVTAAGLTYTRQTAWNFFLQTVKKNFGVILVTASPGTDFQRWCTKYPLLTEHLNYFWFQHLDRQKLVSQALFHLDGVNTLNNIQKENLAHLLGTMHLSIRQLDGEETGCGRYRHLTNTTYEKLVERFISMYQHRHTAIFTEHATVTKVLHHINKEVQLAEKLQKQLDHELVVLEERKQGTIQLLSQIGQDTAITEQQVKVVQKQLDQIQKLKDVLPRYALAHEKAVFKTVAIVQDTKKVVEEMDLDSLAELRGMQKPDVVLEDLMGAIIMILKSPSTDLTWKKGAKRQMANLERFMEELSTFDDHELPETTLSLVEPYLKKASFQPQNLLRKTDSVAAASLCKWVRGVVRYHRLMISKVKPLHKRVEETTAEIEEAQRKLTILESKKKSLEARLLDLSTSFESATVDKNNQGELSVEMSKQLETANRFREILAEEYDHCQQICQSVHQHEFAIFGAVAVAAGFVSYLGPYDHRFRKSVLTVHWAICLQERGIPLIIDAIDPMKGWIIEWAIASSSKSRPGTRVLLSVLSGPQKDAPTRQEYIEGQEDQLIGEDGLTEGPGEGEREVSDGTPHVSIQIDDIHDSATNRNYAFSEAAETHYSYTVDNFNRVSTKEYKKYIQAMLKLLVGEKVVMEWETQGLNTKQMENLAIQHSCWQRPPLMIDPNMEGVRMIRKYIQHRNLVNIDMASRIDPSIIMQIEKAILSGHPLLLMNCGEDSFDNLVTPLIHHANYGSEVQGPQDARLIKYCGRRLLGHENFCVTMATRNDQPRLSSRIASSTMLVNYCSTPESLREELLDRTFMRALPQLYQEQQKAMRALRELRSTLKELEEKLLVVLEGEVSSDAITSHTVYVSSIVDSKQSVYAQIQHLERVLHNLETIKSGLQPVAKRGAMLYAIAASLRGIHREYHVSVPFFIWMFDQAVGDDYDGDVFEGTTESDLSDTTQPPSLSSSKTISKIQTEGTRPGTDNQSPSVPEPVSVAGTIGVTIPHVPKFPSEGVAYNSLSANHVIQLVDSLTQTVFHSVRQSLYQEHRLLFATMICLNIQYETLSVFTEDELSLLLQGNPGLGIMDLTLKDFDSDAPPPEFLPTEKWKDLLAVSVLPGPLAGICVQLAENPTPWAKWYSSDRPENESLPMRSNLSAMGETSGITAEEHGCGSSQSTPDLGDLSDFHQLILFRLLRPDRFPIAASSYVARHLTIIRAIPTSVDSLVESIHHQLGVLILMPPSPACRNEIARPTEVLKAYAEEKNIPFQCITVGEGCEDNVTMTIDAMADKEGWLVLEHLHLASEKLLSRLKHRLVRNSGGPLGMTPLKSGNQSRCCIWMTSEPSSNIPYFLIQNSRVIAWDMFTPLLGSGPEETADCFTPPSLAQSFKNGLVTALKAIPETHLRTLSESTTSVRATAYAVCVIHGLLISGQMLGPTCLSKFYMLTDAQVHCGIEHLLNCKFDEQNRQQDVDGLCHALAELVYNNVIYDHWDQVFVRAIVHEVLSSALSLSGSITLGTVNLPTPPANVDVQDYADWVSEYLSHDRGDSFDIHELSDAIRRSLDLSSGLEFLHHLGRMYQLQHSGPQAVVQYQERLNLTKVQNSVDAIIERLPPLLDLGESPVQGDMEYTFPYYAPSGISLYSIEEKEMPQSVGFALIQECHQLNSLLCQIRQSLHTLESHILGGQDAMPSEILTLARALQNDAVPSAWVHPNSLPCGHSTVSWIRDLCRRHEQMKEWVKERKVPRSTMTPGGPLVACGSLGNLWLGGLFNPGAVITALRMEKASLDNCLLSEVSLACEVPSTETDAISRDGTDAVDPDRGICLTDVCLVGASWDVERGTLSSFQPGVGSHSIPKLHIYPVVQKTSRSPGPNGSQNRLDQSAEMDSQRGVYQCPVFTNGSRQVCAFVLDIPCTLPVTQWEIRRVAIILDPGMSERDPRRWPKPVPRPLIPHDSPKAQSEEDNPSTPSGSPTPESIDLPPPSRESRRSAFGAIHEGITDGYSEDGFYEDDGSIRSKSGRSERPYSQQSGQRLEPMSEAAEGGTGSGN